MSGLARSTSAGSRVRSMAQARVAWYSTVSAVSRTPVSAQLWNLITGRKALKQNATRPPTDFVPKSPADSRVSIDLPLASDPALKSEYLSFRGGVRFGKILEDLDLFAAYTALSHCDDGNPETYPHTLVTACIDRVDLRRDLTMRQHDMVFHGYATWTGRTSLQVNIDLVASDVPDRDALQLSGSLVFVGVGRDGKGMPVNPLAPQTEKERRLCAEGEMAQARRKYRKRTCLATSAPSDAESDLLHRVMSEGSLRRGAVPMAETRMQSVHTMQPQERNYYGKIFGGFLMREAYEIALTAANAFATGAGGGRRGGCPTLVAMDDVTFNQPVNVGDVVSLVARVVYTGGNEVLLAPAGARETGLYQVRVDIGIINLGTGERSLSNTFHFTFLNRSPEAAKDGACLAVPVPPVMPSTYKEGMEWLGGRRRMLESLRFAESLGSFAAHPTLLPREPHLPVREFRAEAPIP